MVIYGIFFLSPHPRSTPWWILPNIVLACSPDLDVDNSHLKKSYKYFDSIGKNIS